jgi:DNA modification methylase
MPYYADDQLTLHHGDALTELRKMADESVSCVVTSPPYYGLRDYGEPGQYGLEPSPAAYVETMRAVFAEVRRLLVADGTLWLNLGDSYAGGGGGNYGAGKSVRSQGGQQITNVRNRADATENGGLAPKNLLGVPWRVAFALQDDGWILRNAIVWDKPNAMPESVTDRLSTTYELVFMFARSPRYWFDLDAVREPLAGEFLASGARNPRFGRAGGLLPYESRGERREQPAEQGIGVAFSRNSFNKPLNDAGRNPGDVWTIPTQPFPAAHFAVMAPELARRCIVAGCRPGGTVLDPFCGSGTTGMVALKHGRRFVGIDLNATYLDLALRTRLNQSALIEDGAPT